MFHLEFVYWLSAAIIFVWLVRFSIHVSRIVADDHAGRAAGVFARREARLLARGMILPAVAVVAALLLLLLARTYHRAHVEKLISAYLAAPRVPVAVREEVVGTDVLFRPIGSMPDMSGVSARLDEIPLNGFYLTAAFDRRQCGHGVVSATVAYEKAPRYDDFSRTFSFSLHHEGPTRLFFPAMSCSGLCGNARFMGLSVPAGQKSCVAGLEAVAGFKSLPLPLWLKLEPDWARSALYQERTLRSIP